MKNANHSESSTSAPKESDLYLQRCKDLEGKRETIEILIDQAEEKEGATHGDADVVELWPIYDYLSQRFWEARDDLSNVLYDEETKP